MLNKHKTIIYLRRKIIKIANVSTGWIKKTTMEAELPWDENNIEAILRDIPKTFKTKNIRILIDPDICYSMVMDWKEKELPTRKKIQDLAAEKIPEHLDNEWWDYKLLVTKEGKKVLFFAPVKEVYEKVINTIKDTELDHEGSYPLEFLPKTKNDFITFAEISLEGKDKDVLSLKPKNKNEEEEKEIKTTKESKKDGEKSKLPMLLGILVILILALVAVILFKRKDPALETPIPEKDPIVLPTEEVINLEEYSLLVLNSTDVAGLAGEAEEILLSEGFTLTETGNATQEVTLSTVAVKAGTPPGVFDNIIRALNSEFDFESESIDLVEENQYDVIVTLGKRKEPAQ